MEKQVEVAICESVRRGYSLFKDIQLINKDEEGRFFVFLFSSDDEINRWTMFFLPVLRKELSIKEYVLVIPHEYKSKEGDYVCRVPHSVHYCTKEEVSALCAYFFCINDNHYRRNTLRVLITGTPTITSERLNNYIDFHGITKREAAAMSVCLFHTVPTDKEVEEACSYVPASSEAKIEWGDHPCGQTDERLAFPASVDLGLDRLFTDGRIDKDDEIALFSVTMTSRHIIQRLTGYQIGAVLDNDPSKEGTLCEGIRVYSPSSYLNTSHRDRLKIIVPTRSYRAICEQLYDYGYLLDKQVFVTYTEYIPYNARQLTDEFDNGKQIYDSIREIYPDERLYYITYDGIGDTYLAGMYLRDRMDYDKVESCVVLFMSQICERVFNILDHKANVTGTYVISDRSEALNLLLYIRQMGYDRLNVCNLTHSYDLIDPGYLRGFKGLDFNTMLQIGTYHAPFRKSGVSVKSRNADHVFEKYQLHPGKTVLLSPAARSAKMVPDDFWQALAAGLQQKGYDVCTNTVNNEAAIKGTLALSLDIEEIYDFVEKAGTFIGLRSGLCDLLSGVDATKVILYHIGEHWGENYTFRFFGIENMGLGDDRTHEFFYDDDQNETIEKIWELI